MPPLIAFFILNPFFINFEVFPRIHHNIAFVTFVYFLFLFIHICRFLGLVHLKFYSTSVNCINFHGGRYNALYSRCITPMRRLSLWYQPAPPSRCCCSLHSRLKLFQSSISSDLSFSFCPFSKLCWTSSLLLNLLCEKDLNSLLPKC